MKQKQLRTCENGHRFYKSSNCPVCPTCEAERTPESAFLTSLSGPARRALENAGIKDLSKLSSWTEKELLALHGFGPASLPVLKNALKAQRLSFRKS